MKLKLIKSLALLMLIIVSMGFNAVTGQIRKNDLIIKKDSSRIESKILIVEDQIIQYKKVSDPDGPIFHLLKSDIAKIIFGNGEILTFPNEINSSPVTKQSSVILYPVRPWVQREFMNDLSTWRATDLRNAYKYYNDRSKSGKIAAIILGSAGAAATVAGIIWARNRNKHDAYGYYTSTDDGPTVLIATGLSTGILGGLIGGTKSKKDHKNAMQVGEELKKRNEPLTSFGIRPSLNPLTKSGSLSFCSEILMITVC